MHDNEKFDNFFDYEEELASLKPSNELYNSSEEIFSDKNDDHDLLKDANSEGISNNSFSGIVMTKKKDSDANISVNNEKPKYMQVEGFNFKQCVFIKEDGQRCKRQAPKTSDKCKKHR